MQLEIFWTSARRNFCQITAYILPVINSLHSLDDLNRFSWSRHWRCSVKKLHRKTSVLESLLIKLKASNFIIKTLQNRYSKAFEKLLANFINFNIGIFFKCNNLIRSNTAIPIMYKLKKCFFNISINILINFLLKICTLLKFYFAPGKLGRYGIAQKSSSVERKFCLV